MNLSSGYGPADPAEAERVLLGALQAGYTFFDTAAPGTAPGAAPASGVDAALGSLWRPLDNVLDFLSRLLTIEPALTVGAAAGVAVAARPGASPTERTAAFTALGLVATVFASYSRAG